MQVNNLTERQANILRDIAAADGFITFSALAQAQGVSSRTIIRELDESAPWQNVARIVLERKAGLGIRLTGAAEDRARISQLLHATAFQIVFSMPDRLLYLRQSLLRENEPIKLFALSRQLKAAESTISGDLEHLDPWFQTYSLTLVRKPGLGIYLEGTESARRQALKELLNEVLTENSLIELMLHPEETPVYKRLNALLQLTPHDIENLRSLIQIVEVWEQNNQLLHRERNFLNMILMLAVLTWRADQPAEPARTAEPPNLKLLSIANSLVEEAAMTLGLPWLLREVAAVAAQLPILYPELTTEIPDATGHPALEPNDLARRMIVLIQSETGFAIQDEDELIEALTTHLQLALTRLKFNQQIYNPLEKEIRENYPKWFDLARKCAELIEQALKKPVPGSETAYLTMYLGAALEKAAARSERRYRIAVLCPAGMSSSVLLASRVEAVFPQVSVNAIISFHQAAEIIQQQRFDMILTTAYIVLPGIPVLTVRPFFPKEDQEKMRQFLTTLVPRLVVVRTKEKEDLLHQLERMNDLVSGLFGLLNNYFFEECDCGTLAAVISQSARHVHPVDPDAFAEALVRRESLGHVVLEEKQMALIHARSAIVADLHFGVLRLKRPLLIDGQPVTTILVMAAPLSVTPAKLDIMRLISRLTIDDQEFSSLLRQGTADEIYHHLEYILKNHFPLNLAAANEHA